MSAPIGDNGDDSEQSRYSPPRFREQPRMPAARPFYVPSTPTVPSDADQDRRTRSEFASWPEHISEPSRRWEDKKMTLMGRAVVVASFAALVAMAIVFAKPIWEGAPARLGADSQTASKSSDRLTADNVPASNVLVPATTIAATSGAGSSASGPAQQAAALSPSAQESRSTVRGVTAGEIRFGISAAFSGPTKELGQNMQRGIVAAFNVANANGGVHGRQLRLIAADDGYEPARAAETMKRLYEKEQVFGVVGNVGTPTAVVALPYALERKMLFFGAFTGAGLLRSDPPDRYVFNYRASYAEETAATVHYLVKVRRLKPEQIAVFAQQDAYGDSGFTGVAKAIRALGGDDNAILRLHYQRNTVDVDEAVEQLKKNRIPIRAVIMVPTYRAAAKFIEKTRD